MLTVGKRPKRSTRRDREIREEDGRRATQHVTVSSGVGQHDKHVFEPAVPELERDPTELRLAVDEAGLGFDRKESGKADEAADGCVPRSLIADRWQRNLGTEGQMRREASS